MKHQFIAILLICVSFASSAFAQSNNSYQIATRLMQQQRYDDALPILQNLYNQQPQVFLFLDKLVECNVQLKDYERAKSIIYDSIELNRNKSLANVLLGKVYHLTGNVEEAYEIWDTNLQSNPNQLQLYLNTANIMTERREFDKAIEVFKLGRQVFNNSTLFMGDIPNVYMQAGRYQEAIGEWLSLIEQNPDQSAAFKRLLISYNDPLLFDDSIAEVEFALQEMPLNHLAYSTFFNLQIWLLFENKLHRRAFAAAQRYELSTTELTNSLYTVGRQLIENNEFELAIKAFDYYKRNTTGEVQWRSMNMQASAYSYWAKFIDDNNLYLGDQSDQLYQRSISILDTLIESAYSFSRIGDVYLKKAELSLDKIFDINEAKAATTLLKALPNSEDTPESNYLEGRIHLAEQSFTRARIAFTRANRLAGVGDIAEKSRYFLALTDFYSGDFEFAQIQLKTLGRLNTSYYANDALTLRLWVQKGTSVDTTGQQLQDFADAHYALYTGEEEKAEQQFLSILSASGQNPLKEDALIYLSKSTSSMENYGEIITDFISTTPYTSFLEQLLWLKAQTVEEQLQSDLDQIEVEERLMNTYLRIIEEFPAGFYAPFARKRLNELPKINS